MPDSCIPGQGGEYDTFLGYIVSYTGEKISGPTPEWNHIPQKFFQELTHSSFDTSPPLTLAFGEAKRGKRVYMSGSWEIERGGEKGPPGAIEEAVIP
jgi:hypothetical protein